MADTSYSFFYDESGQIGDSISLKNALDRTQIRNYIGTFLGCRTDIRSLFEDEISDFLNRHRKEFCLHETEELKSSTIIKKGMKNSGDSAGLSSLSKISSEFYSDLFCLLNQKHIKHCCYSMTCIEMWVRGVFPYSSWYVSHGVIYKAFVYSLSKFLYSYHITDLSYDNIYDSLISVLLSVIDSMKNVRRKQTSEIQVLSNLVCILSQKPKTSINKDRKVLFRYDTILEYFRIWLLYDAKIKTNRICLYLDGTEEQTFVADSHAYDNVFKSVCSIDSKTSVVVQVCDWLSGLFGQFSRWIYNNENIKENYIGTFEEKSKLRWFNPTWFDIPDYTFALCKNMYRFFVKQNNHYYRIGGGYFNDTIAIMMTFLRYINQYDSYDDYKSKSIEIIATEANCEFAKEIDHCNNRLMKSEFVG